MARENAAANAAKRDKREQRRAEAKEADMGKSVLKDRRTLF